MSDQKNESRTVITTLHGGTGGMGGAGGMTGGAGGKGEGATINIAGVQNMTNHIGGSLVVHIDKLKEDLHKWLESPPDTKDRQRELKSLHHQATGGWLLRDNRFVRWKKRPGALWIKGISGTGKSVLSSTVIEEIIEACPEWAIAYFYFDFRNDRQQRMDIMLRSIILQLSECSPSPYNTLHELYKRLGKGKIQPQLIHLQGVLNNLLLELDQTYIVIDGLDECNKTDWKHLIELIHSLCQPTTKMPNLLFTSQPHEEFKNAFKDVTFIELGSAVSNNDIGCFISSEVPRVGNWASDDKYAKHVTEQIVQKSNGMFRMAACLLIELGRCHWKDDWEEALVDLPAELSGIYSRFLTRATSSLKTVFVQAIFRWLVFSARQIAPDELADAIAFRLDNPTFDFSDPAKSIYRPDRRRGNSDSFKWLEGLIIIKERMSPLDGPSIAFAHSSVKDYILSSQFQQKFGTVIDLTMDVSHRFITQTCVRYLLLFSDRKHWMTRDTLPDYPISLYAAEYWFHHLQLCNDQDQKMLLPATMHLLEDGSSQYVAWYHLHQFNKWWEYDWSEPISPAVCMCSELGYIQGVRSLLIERNASFDLVDKYGQTALHLALSNGHLEIARLLIEHNALVDLVDQYGQTALHLASSNGHLEIARLLIKHNTPVDLVNQYGQTALHLASRDGHLDIARLLIEHNALVDLVDQYGWTALHRASSNGHLEIARLLIEHNTLVDLVDQYGQTALHRALRDGHLDIARLLIEHNALVDLVNEYGQTALHLASSNGHLEIARLLIERNALVDLVNQYGQTALHLASRDGHLDIARLLIEHNTPVDLVNVYGQTVLHLALRGGHLDIVRLLIGHNTPVNLVNKHGQTALHLALRDGHLDIARLLIEHGASTTLDDTIGSGS